MLEFQKQLMHKLPSEFQGGEKSQEPVFFEEVHLLDHFFLCLTSEVHLCGRGQLWVCRYRVRVFFFFFILNFYANLYLFM